MSKLNISVYWTLKEELLLLFLIGKKGDAKNMWKFQKDDNSMEEKMQSSPEDCLSQVTNRGTITKCKGKELV